MLDIIYNLHGIFGDCVAYLLILHHDLIEVKYSIYNLQCVQFVKTLSTFLNLFSFITKR